MAISSDSPCAQRSEKVSTENDVPPPTSTAKVNGHTATKSLIYSKMNGHTSGVGNRKSHRINTATIALPKSSIDTSGSSANAYSVEAPTEFVGDVNTNNEIPSQEVLKSVENLSVLDKDGKMVPFRNLYSGPNVARRVLVIFIRHFLCGNCQEFLRTLTDSITPDSLLSLSTPTFITVVGHGSPHLIPMYARETRCPFPIYADPTKKLYDVLGMVRTLQMGPRPEYQRQGTFMNMWQSIRQGVTNLGGGKMKGLDWHQVGGEFLFEPVDLATPITSPADENNKQLGAGDAMAYGEEKYVTWCHRMKNTRDHAELPELREVLGLDGVGVPGRNTKRWTKALGERKGTGLSSRTSISLTLNGGSPGRQSVSIDRSEKQSISVEREKAAAALNGTA